MNIFLAKFVMNKQTYQTYFVTFSRYQFNARDPIVQLNRKKLKTNSNEQCCLAKVVSSDIHDVPYELSEIIFQVSFRTTRIQLFPVFIYIKKINLLITLCIIVFQIVRQVTSLAEMEFSDDDKYTLHYSPLQNGMCRQR